MEQWIADAIFCFLGFITLGGAFIVATNKNIVRCAFALLLCFSGVWGLYAFLGADFLAVVQLLVYIGGVIILFLFSIFLTDIKDIKLSSESMGRIPAFVVTSGLGGILIALILQTWSKTPHVDPEKYETTTKVLGKALLTEYLLPFELISIMLVAVVIGSMVLARKEIRVVEEEGGE